MADLQHTIRALRSASLADSSRGGYRRAVQLYHTYCGGAPSHQHRSVEQRSGVRDLDLCVSRYLASVYQLGGGRRRQLAIATVYGLYFMHPRIRDQLVESQQLLTGWGRLRPSTPHPPLTWPLVTLIAVTMAVNGFADAALATLVSFDALLRVSEMANLRVSDVSAPTDQRRGRSATSASAAAVSTLPSDHVVLRLASTKTGTNQSVHLTNTQVEHLLLLRVQGRPLGARVFQLARPGPGSNPAAAYRRALRVVCDALGLRHPHFTPHSLRHGGATHALLYLGHTIETVMLRGR